MSHTSERRRLDCSTAAPCDINKHSHVIEHSRTGRPRMQLNSLRLGNAQTLEPRRTPKRCLRVECHESKSSHFNCFLLGVRTGAGRWEIHTTRNSCTSSINQFRRAESSRYRSRLSHYSATTFALCSSCCLIYSRYRFQLFIAIGNCLIGRE